MPSVKLTSDTLDNIARDPTDPDNIEAKGVMGLPDSAIDAWREVQADPQHPDGNAVRKRVFDMIAHKLPASQTAGGAGFADRFVLKNLIDRDIPLQEIYLQRKGFETRRSGGREGARADIPVFTGRGEPTEVPEAEVEFKLPCEAQFRPVDPSGFDWFDLFDVVSDVLEAGVTGFASGAKAIGAFGAPVTGGASLAVGSALGGAATAGFEAGKQGVAKLIGAREEIDPGRIAQAGVIGAAAPGVGKVFEKTLNIFSKSAKFVGGVGQKKKRNAAEIEEAMETLGLIKTPGITSASKAVRKAEAELADTAILLPGIGLGVREKIAKNQQIMEDQANSLVENVLTKANQKLGESSKEKLLNGVNEKLRPAEEIYNNISKLVDDIPPGELKPISFGNTENKLLELLDETTDEAVEKRLSKIADRLEKVGDVKQLSKVRSDLLRESRKKGQDGSISHILRETANSLREDRAIALKAQFPNMAEELAKADKIWAETANDIQTLFFKKSEPLKGAVKSKIGALLKDTTDEKAVSRLLKQGDFKQIEKLKNTFPEAFEELREGTVDELLSGSLDMNGKINIGALNKTLNRISEPAKNLIFGKEKLKKIKALHLVMAESEATVRQNPSRLRDIFLAVTTKTGLADLSFRQITNMYRKMLAGMPHSLALKSVRGVGQAVEKIATPGFTTVGSEFTARQLLPRETRLRDEPAFGLPK